MISGERRRICAELQPMASIQKKAERGRKAKAYRDLVRNLAKVSEVYNPTASCIFDFLNRAHLNAQLAESSQLARGVFFDENPEARLPEELSDEAISDYLAIAGNLYGNAATDYVLISDPARAFKYFRKAAQHCTRAAGFAAENGSELLEAAQEYTHKSAIVRQEVARRSIRRRRFSLRFLGRLG